MKTVLRQPCPGPPTRREALRIGALGMAGLSWPQLLQAQAVPARERTIGRAKACIMIYLDGGMSHIDTIDMKPDASAEYRGEFCPIRSTIPGEVVCEHLPRVSQVLNHCALVRSMSQRGRGVIGDNHHTGAYYYLTGREPDRSFGDLRLNRAPRDDDWPFIGSVVSMYKQGEAVLPLVGLPDRARSAQYIRAGQFGARLGPLYDPLMVRGTQDNPGQFTVPHLSLPSELTLRRMQDRRSLLRQLDQTRQHLDVAQTVQHHNEFQGQAYSLLSSVANSRTFDVSREPLSVRERYGNDVNGQSMLLARRLVERGVPFVSVFWQARRNQAERCSGWDTHRNNFHCLKTYLLPYLDVAFSALMEDLSQRGMLDDTLVVLMSEMGRKTRIGDPRDGGYNGRDHWVHCHTVLFGGAGIKPGFVFGASDRTASYPREKSVGPEDLAATIYHAMGINNPTARTPDGREYHLLEDGRPMMDLFS